MEMGGGNEMIQMRAVNILLKDDTSFGTNGVSSSTLHPSMPKLRCLTDKKESNEGKGYPRRSVGPELDCDIRRELD